MPEEPRKLSKQERRDARRREAKRRRLQRRLRQLAIAAAVLAPFALWALEHSGSEELAEAEVVETRRWRHQADDGSSHPHISAKLKIEGLSEARLERADDYERGQRVLVWVRRGTLSGWPYFMDVAKPDEIERHRRRQVSQTELE